MEGEGGLIFFDWGFAASYPLRIQVFLIPLLEQKLLR